MSREKRNNQQSLIETFEDSIMMKDKVIKQLQLDQKEMMLKIQMVKKNIDNDNFKSVTSHNSYDDDQGNFLNDINKRLTYAKMRMGFNSGGKIEKKFPRINLLKFFEKFFCLFFFRRICFRESYFQRAEFE